MIRLNTKQRTNMGRRNCCPIFFREIYAAKSLQEERGVIISKNRVRKNDARLYFTDEEMALVQENMQKVGMKNRSSYLRKMALDGYIIQIDTKPIAELVRLIHISGLNINQVAKRANETGSVYENDVLDLLMEFNRLKPLVVEAHKIMARLDKQ